MLFHMNFKHRFISWIECQNLNIYIEMLLYYVYILKKRATLIYFIQCSAVVFHQDKATTNLSCFVTEPEVRFRKPGNMTVYYVKGSPLMCERGLAGQECDRCDTGWAGSNCDACAPCLTGDNCDQCAPYCKEPDCDSCVQGRAGVSCDACAIYYSDESNCTMCLENGVWEGQLLEGTYLRFHLTFTGPICEDVVEGSLHTIQLNILYETIVI